MTNKQWRKLFQDAAEDIASKTPSGDALDGLWNLAEKEDPCQDNTPLRTAMYLLFAYEKHPALFWQDPSFFPTALMTLFPEGA